MPSVIWRTSVDVSVTCSLSSTRMDGKVDMLAASAAEQELCKQGVTAFTIAAFLGPHWHEVSVIPQPLELTALVRHVICKKDQLSLVFVARWSRNSEI